MFSLTKSIQTLTIHGMASSNKVSRLGAAADRRERCGLDIYQQRADADGVQSGVGCGTAIAMTGR
jgi:hypothetical protein